MPPRSRVSPKEGESTGERKRKPVRRDPEKRRQQNIQAQRKYREKLRKRLEHLETLAAHVEQGTLNRPPSESTGSSEAVTNVTSISPSQVFEYTTPDCDALDTYLSSTSVPSSSTEPLGEHEYVPLTDPVPLAPAIWEPTTQLWQPDNIQVQPTWDATLLAPQSTSFLPLALCEFTQRTPESDDIAAGPIDPSLPDYKKNDTLGPCWTTTIDCGCSSPHFQIRTRGPTPFAPGEIRVVEFEPNGPVANPYANHLRIDTICTITALHTLGTHLALSEDVLCAEDSLSPFFRSSTGSSDDTAKSNMICSVQRSYKSLKPDLRPTREQIIFRHHPQIDIFPFPTLRKNLIIHQGVVDEDSFCLDALTGLVCWGSAGIGRKDRQSGIGTTGTPWDVRSWEARAWFLKKYWDLLGGEEGELVRQSEWWRSMRGDDPLDVDTHVYH
ncbi:hypothetical protein BJX96DRAFT_151369 [Aspergillus floccosus]